MPMVDRAEWANSMGTGLFCHGVEWGYRISAQRIPAVGCEPLTVGVCAPVQLEHPVLSARMSLRVLQRPPPYPPASTPPTPPPHPPPPPPPPPPPTPPPPPPHPPPPPPTPPSGELWPSKFVLSV